MLLLYLPARAQDDTERLKAECDRQAAPFWMQGNHGPFYVDIKPDTALPACLAAAKAAPQDGKMMYQLARALVAAKKYDQARSAFELADTLGWDKGFMYAELGRLFAAGQGGPVDVAAAKRWYEKGASHDNWNSMVLLGEMYDNGIGVAKDSAQAQRLYDRAIARQAQVSNRPPVEAIFLIGWNSMMGEPIKDYAKAKIWFEKSANAGYGLAAGRLGMIYEEGGYGLTRDLAEAKRWYQKGAQAHDDDSVKALKRLQ
ncbi:MAG TPA: tetratricopeptide repeat protein [Xanthobacteraceae bacterium]|nr:tetratricopeptide repeat protein [Xanthobacteraceae bacterium]